ncbi:hypothetical protein FHS31_002230 [Sphingomonas vulcanisoli]|uniref:Glycosyl transferase n=1 Tax=Sphingomonas vulcanisoli TaxID=1658060 RepID=A0ABX0TVA0_9SPHN|nr:UDP-N-acetyl glucosamine 2-epimerase [Sphingomonas vulcanisoli]NIJ08609.1 hypothetical protein [Sphingomonas vulcanisoli]
MTARKRVAFLFLGETLLIPHLWPIVEALAEQAPELAIDCWVSTSVHEQLLGRWKEGLPNVRLRRAPGFLALPDTAEGDNPPLPAKLPMLLRLVPHLMNASVAVCAEQTSLWIPRLLPFLRTFWIKTSHGVGSMSARDDPRRRAADLLLVPSEQERRTYLDRGFDPARVIATGYVKAGFRQRTPARDLFADRKPVIVYAPHWQQHRSSWWLWGREVVAMLAAQDRFNVILAPHQRLFEKDAGAAELLLEVADLPHVHADTRSFAMVDGSYMAAADIYLGDTSSQVIEYLAQPRPCVFLNAQGVDWRATDEHDFWKCGRVVTGIGELSEALDQARDQHSGYIATQQTYATAALGDVTGNAPARIAEIIRHRPK